MQHRSGALHAGADQSRAGYADGFGLRLRHLDIELSKSEQASFFAAYGEEIQATIARKFTDWTARWRAWSSLPISQAR